MVNEEIDNDYGVAPDNGYGGMSDKASIIEKINPDEIVELIRMRLMGKVFNKTTQTWEENKHLKDSAISEKGAWDISNLLLSVSNANTSLSKLDDRTIRMRAYTIMETAVKMMVANWKEYKITNTAQLGFIAEIVFSIVLITLKMADAEGIRKMITSMYSESRNIQQVGEIKGRKMFR
ncbi:hypothetical protein KAU11_10035 [Candidatus Babeliales bacterium]|nr:hypothetical protein [Candidatus Babeliales bacterium]